MIWKTPAVLPKELFLIFRNNGLSFYPCTLHSAPPTEFFHGIYPDRQLLIAAFDGYQGSHLKTIEGFDGEIDWDFLAQDL